MSPYPCFCLIVAALQPMLFESQVPKMSGPASEPVTYSISAKPPLANPARSSRFARFLGLIKRQNTAEATFNQGNGIPTPGSHLGASSEDMKLPAETSMIDEDDKIRRFYEPIDSYEGKHRYDPEAYWAEEEERKLVRKVGLPAPRYPTRVLTALRLTTEYAHGRASCSLRFN